MTSKEVSVVASQPRRNARRASLPREEFEMHPHIIRAAPPQPKTPRPAKVIQLETRRVARLEADRPQPRPAA
jgi:hypothetical protein